MLHRGQRDSEVRSRMKSATRALAAIATSGVLAGGAVALVQVPAPKTASTAAISKSTGVVADQAMQQLTDESARLHAAVESAQGQLADIRAKAPETLPPTANPDDLRALLAQTESQLATTRHQLALDELLLAKMRSEAGGTTSTSVQHIASKPATPTTPTAPVPQATAAAAATTAATTATTAPPAHRTYSPSPRPTNGTGDD
jgi:hypothetical protein